MSTSALSSGTEKLVLCLPYGIARCPHLGVFLSIVLTELQLGPCQVATAIGRCLLREVPLYAILQHNLFSVKGLLFKSSRS